MGGAAANGWRFWGLEGEAPQAESAAAPDAPTKTKGAKSRKLIYRNPNQQGVAEGKTRWFCSACMKGFVQDGDAQPEVCPEGHSIDDPELSAALNDTAVAND